MQVPAKPENENSRVATLRSLNILDTAPEERFDRLTRLAKRLFDVPIALVSLVDSDRQWFKANLGLDARETSRDVSFCGHAILEDDVMVVEDATLDRRFADNPLVIGDPGIRFYAGYPLTVTNGSKLGTFCLLDTRPRHLSEEEHALLRDLAHMAEQEMATQQMANMDELTMLSNRRGFEVLAGHTMSVCRRLQRPLSLLFFDLNGFKQINDRFDHVEGDRALLTFADLLRQTLRESDIIGRLGGDEFVALLVDSSTANTTDVINRLRAAVATYNLEARRGYDIRFSVGQVLYEPDHHAAFAFLLAEADAAMYMEKQSVKRQTLSRAG